MTITTINWWILSTLFGLSLAWCVYHLRNLPKQLRENRALKRQCDELLAQLRDDVEHQASMNAELTRLVALALVLRMRLGLPVPPRVGGEFAPWRPMGHCPDCLGTDLESGPRGGAAINLYCRDCGARWNAVPPMQLIQRI